MSLPNGANVRQHKEQSHFLQNGIHEVKDVASVLSIIITCKLRLGLSFHGLIPHVTQLLNLLRTSPCRNVVLEVRQLPFRF